MRDEQSHHNTLCLQPKFQDLLATLAARDCLNQAGQKARGQVF